MEPHTVNTKKI